MKMQLLSKDKEQVSFLLEGSSPAYSNAIRRLVLGEVPVMAIESVEFKKNSSSLYDEMIAQRLGLVVLKTDLKSYELPESQADVDERKAKSTLTFVLKEKGPKTVYASDLKSADPKVVPIYPKTLIVKLLKDQELELEAIAVLGKGKAHAKWSPGHVYYTFNAKVTVNNKSDKMDTFRAKYPEGAFDKKGNLDADLMVKNGLVDACHGVCDDIVKVEYEKDNYVFYVEPWGQLSAKEMLLGAVEVLDTKLDEFAKLVKAM